MLIYFVGTPGTGKTVSAKDVSKTLNAVHFEIADIAAIHNTYIERDVDRKCWVIDEDKLISILEEMIVKEKQPICLSGPVIAIKEKFVDLIVLLNCDLDVLRQRFKNRNYPRKKIEENIEAELMGVVLSNVLELFPVTKRFEFNTGTMTSREICKKIQNHFHSYSEEKI